jgi:alpha-D-ribose 1-methylphosphonate 5-triphosphate synthase subunit PhnH
MTATAAGSPGRGFVHYTYESQSTFRTLLDAMARPGTIGAVGPSPDAPAPLDPATAAVALCLFDHDTNVWLGDGIAGLAVYEYLRFHAGCPLIKSALSADFAVCLAAAGMPPLAQFNAGSDEYPDSSATLVVQVAGLEDGRRIRLTGPGIAREEWLAVSGVPDYFWAARREQQAIFPRGVDVVFASGERIIALPRSTEIEV